jgi:hypothetical protein
VRSVLHPAPPLVGTATTSSFDVDAFLDVVFVIFVLGAIISVVATGVMMAGCVCALFAGRGSRGSLVAWLALAGLEVVAQVIVLPHLLERGFDIVLVAPAGALVAQVAIYLVARGWRPPRSAGP